MKIEVNDPDTELKIRALSRLLGRPYTKILKQAIADYWIKWEEGRLPRYENS